MHDNFEFGLKQSVAIKISGEKGEVIGRAEYWSAERSYLVRYCAGNGVATEQWWPESALILPAHATA